ncbi:uncharacterized protein [Panulirus ornatus]|uniref:uncharacterized protein isoform X2 n=1 Tax=Panulirus ornatus TaxID=150431 RepID=UPI003A8870E6
MWRTTRVLVVVMLGMLVVLSESALTGNEAIQDIIESRFSIVENALREDQNLTKYVDSQGWTLLLYAAQYGPVSLVSALLDAGADIEFLEQSDGASALHLAVLHKLEDVVRVLTERGSPLETALKTKGYTPLMSAADVNFLEGMQILLDAGAKLEHNNAQGFTALMAAAVRGYVESVELLITYKANINAQDSTGISSLMHAAIVGFKEVARVLVISGANLDLQDIDGNTALMFAAQSTQTMDLLNLLIVAGANLDLQNVHGYTALLLATSNTHRRRLTEAGANLDLQNNLGATAIISWIKAKIRAAVLSILESCPDLTIPDDQGTTALDLAVTWGNQEIVKAIQGKLNATCSAEGKTYPLHSNRYEDCNELQCNSKCKWITTGNQDPACRTTGGSRRFRKIHPVSFISSGHLHLQVVQIVHKGTCKG